MLFSLSHKVKKLYVSHMFLGYCPHLCHHQPLQQNTYCASSVCIKKTLYNQFKFNLAASCHHFVCFCIVG